MKTSGVLLMTVVLAPLVVRADGGAVCLSKISGLFLVTVFASPEPLRAGPIDISILVQDARTGGIVLDATVDLEIQPLSGHIPPIPNPALSEAATTKLLQ